MGKLNAGTKGEHTKDIKAKYRQTPKGKRMMKKAYSKYGQSDKGKQRARRAGLKFHYGITLEEYNQILEKQKGCCAICGRHQSETHKSRWKCKLSLSVDHNHITRQIRGLLCGTCNRAIGSLKVDELGDELLKKAIDYINRAKEAKDGKDEARYQGVDH